MEKESPDQIDPRCKKTDEKQEFEFFCLLGEYRSDKSAEANQTSFEDCKIQNAEGARASQ